MTSVCGELLTSVTQLLIFQAAESLLFAMWEFRGQRNLSVPRLHLSLFCAFVASGYLHSSKPMHMRHDDAYKISKVAVSNTNL